MDIEELEKIISLLKRNDITEFELNEGGIHLKLHRGVAQVITAPTPARVGLEPAVVAAAPLMFDNLPGGTPEANGRAPSSIPVGWVKVESPIVGTFYRKPNPEAEAFVSEGATVKKGDTLCIVEAMKLMNEIEAPVGGRVEKVLLNDGQVVEFGEVLFYINPSA